MFTKYLIPLFAFVALVFATMYVSKSKVTWPKTPPPTPPPTNPFKDAVAGAGLVEAETENINIGSPLPGVAVEVLVKVGQRVRKNDPLFRIDDRAYQSELKVRQSALLAAGADLARLESQPRSEDIPVLQAKVEEAEANLADQQYQNNRTKELVKKGAASEDERFRREQAFQMARAQLEWSKADLARLKAGAWDADKIIARAAVEQAAARVDQAKTDLDRLVVRALVDGQVLQVNVRPGEYVSTPAAAPLIVLGNIDQMHVRVDIDEYDIHRYHVGMPAVATIKGNPTRQYPMSFVRVEPYVIPKRSLTGDNTERVDTRVLQVIYRLDTQGERFYVGQQLDVFFQTSPTSAPAGSTAQWLRSKRARTG